MYEKPRQDELSEEVSEEKIDLEQQKRDELFALYKEVEKTGDRNKKIYLYFLHAQANLEQEYGVRDLTTIEGVHLRNIIEDLLPRFEKERELVKKGEMRYDNSILLESEVPALWLLGLYGIHVKDVPASK